MKYGLTEIEWDYVGAKLAQEGSDEQIKFFKSFVKESGTWGTRWQVEKQFSFINLGLTDQEKDTLSMLGFKGEE